MINKVDATPPASGTRYPKRKRAPVKYYESDSESDSDGYDSSHFEVDYVPINKKAKSSKSTKPLPKRKIFPFMELPGELRNKLYIECLFDDDPICIVSKQSSFRRFAKRVPQWPKKDPYSVNHNNNNNREQQHNFKSLVPAILALSKTIYAEAVPFLYSQRIIVQDNHALLNLVAALTPLSAALLHDITITLWSETRAQRSVNFPAMTVLAARGVTNLTRLNLDCHVSGDYNPKNVAKQIYRDCYHWLVAVGEAKGNPYAALDVLKVSEFNFYSQYGGGKRLNGKELEEAEEEMKQELRNLLNMI